MAKIYKIEAYLIDVVDRLEDEDLKNSVSEYLSSKFDCIVHENHTSIKESRGFAWDDNLDLNMIDCKKEDYDKYFIGAPDRRCESYFEKVYREPRYDTITGEISYYVDVTNGYCAKMQDKCNCSGKMYRCIFNLDHVEG